MEVSDIEIGPEADEAGGVAPAVLFDGGVDDDLDDSARGVPADAGADARGPTVARGRRIWR